MKKMTIYLCFAFSIICILYCIGIIMTKAAGTKFFLVWLLIAGFFGAFGYGLKADIFMSWPFWLRMGSALILLTGMLVFCFVEGMVLSKFHSVGEQGLSHIIVLGAQMKKNGPSIALARRLDCAADYLVKNSETICIVSGGKGDNEPISEAQGMYDYLIEKGISPERIIKEEQSRNTQQNLLFSRALIPHDTVKVGIITNNFHVYRSVQLAKSQGFPEAVGIGSGSGYYFLPNNMLREFFGVMKDWLMGNMKLF